MQTKLIVSALLTQSVGAVLYAAPQALKPGVEEQLRAQFTVTRVGANGAVLQAGQVLVVQLDGMEAYYASVNSAYRPNDFKKNGKRFTQTFGGGILRMPVGGLAAIPHLAVGDKVYLTVIEFRPRKDEIVFSVQSCGSCNPAVPYPVALRAALTFHFPKGSLETADYGAIQEAIGRVFAIDTSPPPIPTETPQQPVTYPPVEQPTQPVQAVPPPPPPDPATTVTINLGDTIDQVVAAMGQPDRKAKVGNKDIYFYKDMKITFVDGRVSDIQ